MLVAHWPTSIASRTTLVVSILKVGQTRYLFNSDTSRMRRQPPELLARKKTRLKNPLSPGGISWMAFLASNSLTFSSSACCLSEPRAYFVIMPGGERIVSVISGAWPWIF